MTYGTTNEPMEHRAVAGFDRGTTFIEILVSVVLLGIAGIAVLVGMSAALRSTATHDRLATVQVNLADAGDRLTDVTLSNDTYTPCASTLDYADDVLPFQVTVRFVDFWDGGTWRSLSDPTFACTGDELQRILLASTVNSVERELTVLKREATVAYAPGGAWNDEIVNPEPNPGFNP